MVDASTPRGLHYHVKSEWLADLPDGVIDALAAQHLTSTSPLNQILLHQMGGAVTREPSGGTAFTSHDMDFVITVAGCWQPGDVRDPHVRWVRSTWEAALPASLGGSYVNHLDADEGEARVRAAYGPTTYDRLVAVKSTWDPDNVFAGNQNIRPTT